MPLEIEPITRAPSRAVQTEPRPPKRLVPAITGAGDRQQQQFAAAGGLVDGEQARGGQDAADRGHRAGDREDGDADPVDRMPARRAASALPPTAKTWRPKPVRLTTYSIPTTKPSRISTASGTPRSELRTATATIVTTATSAEADDRAPAGLSPSSPAATRRRWPSDEHGAVGDDHDRGEDPADRVGVEGVGEAGDLRVGEVDRAGVPST